MYTYYRKLFIACLSLIAFTLCLLFSSGQVMAAPNAACSWPLNGSPATASGSNFERRIITAQYNGLAPPGTMEPSSGPDNCDTAPPAKPGMVAIAAELDELPSDCLHSSWEPTGSTSALGSDMQGTNFADHVARCRPAGSSFLVDDSGIITIGNHTYCMGRNDPACPPNGRDYVANLTTYEPRSIGYRKYPTAGTSLPLNASGGVDVRFSIKQQYEDGFYFAVAIKFIYVPAAISCNLTASLSSIVAGSSSTLTWTTMGGPTSATINNSIGAVSASGGSRSVSPTSTTTYTMTVSKSGVPDATCSTTISTSATPAPLSCPGDPTINNDNNRSVTLPDLRDYPAASSSNPGSDSGTSVNSVPGARPTVYQDVNGSSPYRITSAADQWGQSPNLTPGLNTWSDNPFIVGYQPYVQDYPYDFHSPTLGYQHRYTRYTWTDSVTVTSEVYTEPVEAVPCEEQPDGSCTGGSPYEPGYTTYTWERNYSSNTALQTENNSISPTTGGLHAMSPCYDRAFNNTRTTQTSALFDDSEKPSSVTFGNTNMVNMYLPAPPAGAGVKGLRESLKVQLDIRRDFYVKHADGLITRPWPQPQQSGLYTVNTPSTNTNIMHDSGMLVPNDSAYAFSNVFAASFPTSGVMRVGDRACLTIEIRQLQGRMRTDGSRTSASGTSGPTAEVCSQPLVNQPYVKAYGSDVSAGGAYEGATTCNQPGRLRAYYRPGDHAGSSSQLGALAIGAISQFASAAMRTAPPLPTEGLTFSNNGSSSDTDYGGPFGGSHCITDYFATMPGATNAIPDQTNINLSSPLNGPYRITGDARITSGDLPNGRHVTLYVDGNVVITDNVQFVGSAVWVSQDQIPSLYIIARNIFIEPNVTRLDGVYVAQPTDKNNPNTPLLSGRIYTCANGTTPVATVNLFTTCNQQLTVNGSFIAQKVNLLRTYSSMRYGGQSEFPLAPTTPRTCSPGVTNVVCGAEVFNFTPESYLVNPSMKPLLTPASGKYEFITSLSPIL